MESRRIDAEHRTDGGFSLSPRLQALEEAFHADGGIYKAYRVGDLFRVEENPQLNKDSFVFSERAEYPYFTRTGANNGILGYVEYLDEAHKIPGNSLAVGMIAMQFFYMAHDFYAGQFTKTVFPKFDGFNERVALYFITLFNRYQIALQSILVRDFKSTFATFEILLPTNAKNEIDFRYMEERIRCLEEERIRCLETYFIASGLSSVELTPVEMSVVEYFRSGGIRWKKFKVKDLFEFLPAKYLGREKRQQRVSRKRDDVHSVPLICAKRGDNGIMYWGREAEFVTYRNVLSVIYNGAIAAGLVYAQEDAVGIYTDSYLLRVKECEVPFRVNLFLKTALEKAIYEKYSREHKAVWKRIREDEILLPVTEIGSPDWTGMEALIAAESRYAIADVVAWKDDIIQKTRELVSRST